MEGLPSTSVEHLTEYEKEKTVLGQLSVCLTSNVVQGRPIFQTKSPLTDIFV